MAKQEGLCVYREGLKAREWKIPGHVRCHVASGCVLSGVSHRWEVAGGGVACLCLRLAGEVGGSRAVPVNSFGPVLQLLVDTPLLISVVPLVSQGGRAQGRVSVSAIMCP